MNADKQRAFDFADSIVAGRPTELKHMMEWKLSLWKQFKKSEPNLNWKPFLVKLARIEHFHKVVSGQPELP